MSVPSPDEMLPPPPPQVDFPLGGSTIWIYIVPAAAVHPVGAGGVDDEVLPLPLDGEEGAACLLGTPAHLAMPQKVIECSSAKSERLAAPANQPFGYGFS